MLRLPPRGLRATPLEGSPLAAAELPGLCAMLLEAASRLLSRNGSMAARSQSRGGLLANAYPLAGCEPIWAASALRSVRLGVQRRPSR